MVLRNIETGEDLEAVVEMVTPADFKIIKKSVDRFDKGFNWSDYKDKEVYKIRLKNDEIILGLMCIIDHTDPSVNAIEILLLESSAENIGKDKKIDFIGGCLIAFACRESFKRGHEGVVYLVPKSGLVEHYTDQYGFHHWPQRTSERPEGIMFLYEPDSRKLIKSYHE